MLLCVGSVSVLLSPICADDDACVCSWKNLCWLESVLVEEELFSLSSGQRLVIRWVGSPIFGCIRVQFVVGSQLGLKFIPPGSIESSPCLSLLCLVFDCLCWSFVSEKFL